jgi:hypothetical protein
MFVLQIQQTGANELIATLGAAAAEFGDWSKQFEKLEPEATIQVQQKFDQEGPGWMPLEPGYAAFKAKHYPGKTILRRTDALYHSFESGATGNVTRIQPMTAEFGSNLYGIYHQTRRPIINITGSDEDRFIHIVMTDKAERFIDLGLSW